MKFFSDHSGRHPGPGMSGFFTGFFFLFFYSLLCLSHSVPANADDGLLTSPQPYRGLEEELSFSVSEGKNLNEFYRRGPIASHLVMSEGTKPRFIAAFPAGNSGVSLWFGNSPTPVGWQLNGRIKPVHQRAENGVALYGVSASFILSSGELHIDTALLGSIRTIRNYMHRTPPPPSLRNQTAVTKDRITWYRRRLDGQSAYKLVLTLENGTAELLKDGRVKLSSGSDDHLRLCIEALTGDQPLTPIPASKLLNEKAGEDQLSRNMLAFLSYEEKMLAGSWRFLTYFGRDTLLSTRLLMPVLTDYAIEAALGSVIDRMALNGEVAHEEDIGEFAILRRFGGQETVGQMGVEERAISAAPGYDYKMVDDNFLLAPVLDHYISSRRLSAEQLRRFLARQTPGGKTYANMLWRNFAFIVSQSQSFAEMPVPANLIALKEGLPVGEWRDSDEGLGGGKYAYNVNAALVPAALASVGRLLEVWPEYSPDIDVFREKTRRYRSVWDNEAPGLFDVEIDQESASRMVNWYASSIQLPLAVRRSVSGGPVEFPALSIDGQGKAIPVMNSDIGFRLLFSEVSAGEALAYLNNVLEPFPVGLRTPVGVVVANAAYADETLQALFTNGHYHGSVVWSWQQALLVAGVDRVLGRSDLSQRDRAALLQHRSTLWDTISSTQRVNTSELWSWKIEGGDFRLAPFGANSGHQTESNAAQLWSTVYLALQR